MFNQLLIPESKYGVKCPYTMNSKGICIHNTANDAPAKNEASYMTNNNNEVSFHVVVDDVEAIQVIPFNRNAWHAGDGGSGAGNRNYIAIEICYSKSGGDKFIKSEQRAVKAAANICRMYGWNENNIKAHRDFINKNCPHRTDMTWFKSAVAAELRGTTAPTGPVNPPTNPAPSPNGRFVHLKPHMTSWAVYPLDKKPVKANACGYLNPSAYGGLDYEILGNPQADVYTIHTTNFGKVNIYIPVDGDSRFYDKKAPTSPPVNNRQYLNLHPHVPSWRVYPLNKPATVGNECGSLAPAQFGGLSYEIIESRGEVKIIDTQNFGRVQIYAPSDADSDVTNTPRY